MQWIEIDGSMGEGGGQVLRTSLALAAMTQKALRVVRIRANRGRSGLLRQHLTALNAMAAVSGATMRGAHLGSSEIEFEPGPLKHGEYHFVVGSAGSTALVLHTVVTALLRAPGQSRIIVEGGTDAQAAPPSDFMELVWAPSLRRLGVELHYEVERRGYYPGGGGRVVCTIESTGRLNRLELLQRGATVERFGVARVSALPREIANREIHTLRGALGLTRSEIRSEQESSPRGPGNTVSIRWRCESAMEVFTAFGELGRPAEVVAGDAAVEALRWFEADVPVGEHSADQLVLLMAIAGGGAFRTLRPSLHARTQLELIPRFLPVQIQVEHEDTDRVRIAVVSPL